MPGGFTYEQQDRSSRYPSWHFACIPAAAELKVGWLPPQTSAVRKGWHRDAHSPEGGQVRARTPHTFPQCATGEAALPHQTRSGGMEGSVHRSSHMEANTYLIHQGGGNKESTGSTGRWGWLPCADGPRGKANERVGSGCSPRREVEGHQGA